MALCLMKFLPPNLSSLPWQLLPSAPSHSPLPCHSRCLQTTPSPALVPPLEVVSMLLEWENVRGEGRIWEGRGKCERGGGENVRGEGRMWEGRMRGKTRGTVLSDFSMVRSFVITTPTKCRSHKSICLIIVILHLQRCNHLQISQK